MYVFVSFLLLLFCTLSFQFYVLPFICLCLRVFVCILPCGWGWILHNFQNFRFACSIVLIACVLFSFCCVFCYCLFVWQYNLKCVLHEFMVINNKSISHPCKAFCFSGPHLPTHNVKEKNHNSSWRAFFFVKVQHIYTRSTCGDGERVYTSV